MYARSKAMGAKANLLTGKEEGNQGLLEKGNGKRERENQRRGELGSRRWCNAVATWSRSQERSIHWWGSQKGILGMETPNVHLEVGCTVVM